MPGRTPDADGLRAGGVGALGEDRPRLVSSGRAGSENPRLDQSATTAWMKRAVRDSGGVSSTSAVRGSRPRRPAGRDPGDGVADQVVDLTYFRAMRSSRSSRSASTSATSAGACSVSRSWVHLAHVLTLAPAGLDGCTSPRAGAGRDRADEIYAATFAIVQAKSERFYDEFPLARTGCGGRSTSPAPASWHCPTATRSPRDCCARSVATSAATAAGRCSTTCSSATRTRRASSTTSRRCCSSAVATRSTACCTSRAARRVRDPVVGRPGPALGVRRGRDAAVR